MKERKRENCNKIKNQKMANIVEGVSVCALLLGYRVQNKGFLG